jgi:hypothetical protein
MIASPLSGSNAVNFNLAPFAASITRVVGANAEQVRRIQNALSGAIGRLTLIDVRAFSYSVSMSAPTAAGAQHTDAFAAQTFNRPLLIRDLGWSEAEDRDVYRRLQSFQEDWDAPGMDAYDAL